MAEVKLNEAKYRLLQAQSNFETGRMAFNSLIGIPLQTATEIEATLPIVNPPDSLLHQNRVNRPEIEMAQDRIKIAESNLTLNDSQYKPQLSIGIDGSYSSPGYNFKQGPGPELCSLCQTIHTPVRMGQKAQRQTNGPGTDRHGHR